MKISDIYKEKGKGVLSFEIFPPKKDDELKNIEPTLDILSELKPDYISENAVISLSLWGEAFNHPDLLKFVEKVLSYKGLSLFLETDGLLVTQSFCQSLKSIVETSKNENQLWPKMMIAVSLDALEIDKKHIYSIILVIFLSLKENI